MAASEGCACGQGPVLIFACSGAADVGAAARRAAGLLRPVKCTGAGR